MIFFELIGWLGSFIYILSYFLLSYKIIDKGKLYYLLNKLAALLVVVISIIKNTFQPVFINAIWLYISYLGYHNKSINIKFLNKNILHWVSLVFFVFSIIAIFINIELSFDILAWFSVFGFSASYFLYSMNLLKEKAFHFYNFLAAISLIPKMIIFSNHQVVLLEALWALFALIAYIKSSKNRDYLTLCS